jgi:serine protease inhibitor
LWTQQDYPFLDEYLDLAEKYYAGKATNLDFKTETEKSRKIINDWVEKQTVKLKI